MGIFRKLFGGRPPEAPAKDAEVAGPQPRLPSVREVRRTLTVPPSSVQVPRVDEVSPHFPSAPADPHLNAPPFPFGQAFDPPASAVSLSYFVDLVRRTNGLLGEWQAVHSALRFGHPPPGQAGHPFPPDLTVLDLPTEAVVNVIGHLRVVGQILDCLQRPPGEERDHVLAGMCRHLKQSAESFSEQITAYETIKLGPSRVQLRGSVPPLFRDTNDQDYSPRVDDPPEGGGRVSNAG